VILKALCQAIEVIRREASQAVRMKQTSVLGEPRRRSHYNIETGRADLSGGCRSHRSPASWRHAAVSTSHGFGSFCRHAPLKNRDTGGNKHTFGWLEREIRRGTTADPMEWHIIGN
jgi:hypothetical protein